MTINGKLTDLPTGISITQLLQQLNLSSNRMVIAVNFEIVHTEQYKATILNQDDQIEIISMVGGG